MVVDHVRPPLNSCPWEGFLGVFYVLRTARFSQVHAERPPRDKNRPSAVEVRRRNTPAASKPSGPEGAKKRGRSGGHSSDASPPRRGSPRGVADRADDRSDSDLSLPRNPAARKAGAGSDSDLSPPRKPAAPKASAGSDSDLSLPRNPAARKAGAGSDSDLSLPRNPVARKAGAGSDSDLSLPRNPAARKASAGSDSDLSLPRNPAARKAGAGSDSDLSPPRKRSSDGARPSDDAKSPKRRPPAPGFAAAEEEEKVGGHRAGIMSFSEIQQSNLEREEKKTKELARAKELQEQRGPQQTVYRDALGRVISAEQAKQTAAAAKKKKAWVRQSAADWGRGVHQDREQERKAADDKKIGKAAFSRFTIDEDTQAVNKARGRWEDPMAGVGSGGGNQETAKPVCKHAMPPNRFDIRPGYRWDGKIRGTGFEDRYFAAVADKKRRGEARDRYEVQDW